MHVGRGSPSLCPVLRGPLTHLGYSPGRQWNAEHLLSFTEEETDNPHTLSGLTKDTGQVGSKSGTRTQVT